MAEGFEPYHVPQQSRRDKLRVGGCVNDNLNQGCVGLLPLYDPSSLDLLTCAALHPHHNAQTSYQDMANNPFFYAPQNLNPSFNNNITSTQGLSLTLSSSSSHHNSYMYGNNNNNNNNDDDKVTAGYTGVGSTSSDVSRNNNHHRHSSNNMLLPLGPFVGYATILKESRFSKPAEQLLQGICDVGCGNYAEKITSDSPLMDPPPLDAFTGTEFVDHPRTSSDDLSKKSRLISMLDEVYRRYKQYYQQVQAVVASFENVPGLSNAAPYAHLALKAMNKHFGYLKNMITDQLQFAAKSPQGQIISYGNEDSSPKGIFGQKQIHNNGNNNNQLLHGFNEHQPPVWRPQRGLPERAVTVLRAWLFEHFLHPYPTDTDKLMLAKQTGLSRNQVSNWFINARVRLWKPMVEEIHTLETRESQKSFQREDQSANSGRLVSNHFSQSTSSSVMAAENPSTSSTQMVQDISLKRTRNVFLNNPMGIEEPMNLMYNNSLHNHNNHNHNHQEMGVGTSGVSLTLGLHQNNNGVVFPEPYPINAARRFGLDSNSDQGFVMGSYEGQNRQIGRNYLGGQLLHDFVG